jgi:hypothetical protein
MSLDLIADSLCQQLSVRRAPNLLAESDPDARQILQIITRTGEDINKRVEWPTQHVEVSLPNSAASFNIPADFHRMVEGGGVYEATAGNYLPVKACPNIAVYRFLAKRPSAQRHYVTDGTLLRFTPVLPTAGGRLNYIRKNWIQSGTPVVMRDMFIDETDNPVFPDRLMVLGSIYRWKLMKRQSYVDELAEFEQALEDELKGARGHIV